MPKYNPTPAGTKECHRCHEVKPETEFNKDKNAPGGLNRWCRPCISAYHGRKYTPKSPLLKPAPEGFKCCTRCGEIHPATREFFNWCQSRGVRQPCRVCGRKWAKEHHDPEKARYYEARRDKEAQRQRQRDYRAQFPERAKESMLRYAEKNRAKLVACTRRWQIEHAEEHKAAKKRYRLEHPEKDREYNHNRRARKLNAEGSYTAADIKLLLKSQKHQCWWCSVKLVGKDYHIDHRIPLSRGGSNAPENLCITCPSCNLSKNNKLPQEWNGRLL